MLCSFRTSLICKISESGVFMRLPLVPVFYMIASSGENFLCTLLQKPYVFFPKIFGGEGDLHLYGEWSLGFAYHYVLFFCKLTMVAGSKLVVFHNV